MPKPLPLVAELVKIWLNVAFLVPSVCSKTIKSVLGAIVVALVRLGIVTFAIIIFSPLFFYFYNK
jgi:hypothetical protein